MLAVCIEQIIIEQLISVAEVLGFCAVCIGLSYKTVRHSRLMNCIVKRTNLLVSAKQTHVDGFGNEWINNHGFHGLLSSQLWLLKLNF